MSSSNNFTVRKLLGRDNYHSWAFAVRNLLELDELWDCVTSDEPDQKLDAKARNKIVLLVDEVNYIHISNAKTSKEVWNNLKTAFDDSGLCRKIGLLRKLTSQLLENCDSVEEYVNTIISTAHKLNSIGMTVSEEWIGALLLTGLPAHYDPMIMAIESSGLKITGDSIKTKLLQDVKKFDKNEQSAFLSKNESKSFKGFTCFKCNRRGHKANNCPNSKKSSSSSSKSNHGFCSVFLLGGMSEHNWYVDSGASAHMTMRKDWLEEICESEVKEIFVANKEKLEVECVGNVRVKVLNNGRTEEVVVHDVLYVPKLTTNLLSVSKIINRGCQINFDSSGCTISYKNEVMASATLMNNIYKLVQPEFEPEHRAQVALSTVDSTLWHHRLAHLNEQDLIKLKQMATGIDFTEKQAVKCVPCIQGKMARKPFKSSDSQSSEILQLVHTDLCGPMENPSMGKAKYFVTFIDDFSRKVFVYFLESKSDVVNVFLDFLTMVEKQTGSKIKCLRSDNGTEYCNKNFQNLLKRHGIIHQTTVPYSPQQNGTSERMNRTIVERARTILIHSCLSKKYWAEAVANVVYVINRSPCTKLEGKTPEEAWSGKKPDVSHMKVFGCKAQVYIPKEKRKKWDAKSKELIFVGYFEGTKGYRLIDPNNFHLTKSRDVVFFENQFLKSSNSEKSTTSSNQNMTYGFEKGSKLVEGVSDQSNSIDHIEVDAGDETITTQVECPSDETNDVGNDVDNVLNDDTVEMSEDGDDDSYVTTVGENSNLHTDEQSDEEYVPPASTAEASSNDVRHSQRVSKPKNFDDYHLYSCVTNCGSPETVQEALDGPNAKNWTKAMKDEFQSLMDNETWTLTSLPIGRKAIKCKWVFKLKCDADGKIDRYKARLVIKGCSQKEGIDYNETFSPVVRYTSIRYLLAVAAQYNLDVEQMDAITAFLQGDLNEEIYMTQPEGFEKESGKVCKLNKAIYGLKQASREWNKKLDSVLREAGLQRSKLDPCIYFDVSAGKMLFIALYVDDLLFVSNNDTLKRKIKQHLLNKFAMKDLGEAKNCVGLRITRDRKKGEIYVDQETYANDILKKFNMHQCNSLSIPADPNQTLMKNDSTDDYKVPYQQAIGSLLYLVQGTRPDLAYAVNSVSRFNGNYNKSHWIAVKRIFRYLKGTAGFKLVYSKSANSEIVAYCDADWASDAIERRSCTGYVFQKQGAAISWNSKRQPTVALSTTEAEYMSLSSTLQEAEWFRQLELELWQNKSLPIKIFCDNRGAIHLSTNDGYHARTKHIDIRHHFVRQKIMDGHVLIEHVPTTKMIADILTKAVPFTKLDVCTKAMGLRPN